MSEPRSTPTPRERMLWAATGRPTDRPPVWLMRQAGRYLPEYQSIRAGTTFIERSSDPDLAAEISLQPFERFAMDGVVVFSDILIPLIDAGVDLAFDDEAMSREHAAIEFTKGGYRIRDLASTNGVYINDAHVAVGDLKHGDRFQLGDHLFTFVLEEIVRQPKPYAIDDEH